MINRPAQRIYKDVSMMNRNIKDIFLSVDNKTRIFDCSLVQKIYTKRIETEKAVPRILGMKKIYNYYIVTV
jgi:hypothetical protein